MNMWVIFHPWRKAKLNMPSWSNYSQQTCCRQNLCQSLFGLLCLPVREPAASGYGDEQKEKYRNILTEEPLSKPNGSAVEPTTFLVKPVLDKEEKKIQ